MGRKWDRKVSIPSLTVLSSDHSVVLRTERNSRSLPLSSSYGGEVASGLRSGRCGDECGRDRGSIHMR